MAATPDSAQAKAPATLTVERWSPGEDVIEVTRTPAPGPARGTWRTFRETVPRPGDDLRRFTEHPVTVQYPEEKTPSIHASADATSCTASMDPHPLEKCVGCSLCAAACPADCIRVVAAENTPKTACPPASATRPCTRSTFALHLLRLLRGRLSVRRDHDGTRLRALRYDRTDLIFTKEMLLAEPLERTPLRNEGD